MVTISLFIYSDNITFLTYSFLLVYNVPKPAVPYYLGSRRRYKPMSIEWWSVSKSCHCHTLQRIILLKVFRHWDNEIDDDNTAASIVNCRPVEDIIHCSPAVSYVIWILFSLARAILYCLLCLQKTSRRHLRTLIVQLFFTPDCSIFYS